MPCHNQNAVSVVFGVFLMKKHDKNQNGQIVAELHTADHRMLKFD